mmetsp:Transcript_33985/g.85970  ORF Transcript_33985/g.85970 Transcript_33985/m.85970 type:complete len:215 (-) Transcript_33985:59-703(-)
MPAVGVPQAVLPLDLLDQSVQLLKLGVGKHRRQTLAPIRRLRKVLHELILDQVMSQPLPHPHGSAVIVAALDHACIPPSQNPRRHILQARQLRSSVIVPLNHPSTSQFLSTHIGPCVVLGAILLIIVRGLPPIVQDKKPRRGAAANQPLQALLDAFGIHLGVKGIPGAPTKVIESGRYRLLGTNPKRPRSIRNSCKRPLQQLIRVLAACNEDGC